MEAGVVSDFTITLLLQLAAIVTTFASLWAIGNKSNVGPWLGQLSNATWAAFYIYVGFYGLLIVPLVMVALHARMSWKWRMTATREASLNEFERKAVKVVADEVDAAMAHLDATLQRTASVIDGIAHTIDHNGMPASARLLKQQAKALRGAARG
jgi:hypothetical protein